MQTDLYGNEVIEEVKIDNMSELVDALNKAEYDYKSRKFLNEMIYNKELLALAWDKIDKERVDKGLKKLGNQEMKKAYVKKMMYEKYHEEFELEQRYNELRRKYEVSLKYSFEILK